MPRCCAISSPACAPAARDNNELDIMQLFQNALPTGEGVLAGGLERKFHYISWKCGKLKSLPPPLARVRPNGRRSLPLGNIRKPPAVDEVEMMDYSIRLVFHNNKNVRNYYIVKFYGFLTPHPSRRKAAPPSPRRGRLLHAAYLYMLVQSRNLPPIAQWRNQLHTRGHKTGAEHIGAPLLLGSSLESYHPPA